MRPLYRMVPKNIRQVVIKIIPQSRRMTMTRQLSRSRVRLAVKTKNGSLLVRDNQKTIRAKICDGATPLDVRNNNLDATIEALDLLGVPHFRVTTTDPYRSAVAVPLNLQDVVRDNIAQHLDTSRYLTRWRTHEDKKTRRKRGSNVHLSIFAPVVASNGHAVYGQNFACDIEFWRQEGKQLKAPRKNAVTETVSVDNTEQREPDAIFSAFTSAANNALTYRTKPEFALTPPDRVTFPIDAVYTWVNGDDPAWQVRKQKALAEHTGKDQPLNPLAASDSRYTNRDELKFSLRSLHANAPWIRHVYLVTDDQVPHWLDESYPKVTVVSHREIFGDTGKLPTFNSHAIESRLHRIEGLAEHFLYINDDMFFGRPTTPDMFFSPNGLSYFFPSPAMVDLKPASRKDSPVDAAAKNNRVLIERHFGRTTVRKMKHIVYPLRRSILADIERECVEEVSATASHQFRDPTDLSITSSLYHYWAYCSGQAVPSKVSYMYADLADPSTPLRLAELVNKRNMDSFCLNDTDSAAVPLELQHAVISDFLAAYFPHPSPFERSPDTPRPAITPPTGEEVTQPQPQQPATTSL